MCLSGTVMRSAEVQSGRRSALTEQQAGIDSYTIVSFRCGAIALKGLVPVVDIGIY